MPSAIEYGALLGVIINKIGAASLSEIAIYHLELCTIEIVNNIIEHALQAVRQTSVDIELTLEADTVSILIRYVAPDAPPPPALPEAPPLWDDPRELPLARLPERGRGLAIVHTLMDTVQYTREGSLHTFWMQKSLSPEMLHLSRLPE